MPGSTDPGAHKKARSLPGGRSDRTLAVPLIALVTSLELGWVALAWLTYRSGDDGWGLGGLMTMVVTVLIAIGAIMAAVAVVGLVRDRLWGLLVGLIWAIAVIAFAGYMVVATIAVGPGLADPSGGISPAARSVPLVFGIATAASIAVFILLARDRPAAGSQPPHGEASPPPMGDQPARPRQVWPSSRRSARRWRRPPPGSSLRGPT
jgi:hypothetical protein